MSLKLYGCSDMVLVPSQFEPCGLSQMIAMRYGALPIVRETGGLKDSVTPYNEYTGEGNGFTFANYNAHELLYTVQRAVRLFHEDRPGWDGLVRNAFATDFSWRKSARQYLELYRGVMEDTE
jgi:starch synthase